MAKGFKPPVVSRIASLLVLAANRAGLKIGAIALLTVRGRKSGLPRTTPVAVVERDAGPYLVATYGVTNWVRNLRAAGVATLARGHRSEPVTAIELAPAEAAVILRERLRSAPSFLRAYFDVTPTSALEEFEREVLHHPVFLLEHQSSQAKGVASRKIGQLNVEDSGGNMMTREQQLSDSEWTGMRGRIGGWYLNSPLRRLSEILILGDCRAAFIAAVSRIAQGNETVLDVGAGSGHYSLVLAKNLSAGKVICLDLSEEMLGHLERKAEQQGLRDRIRILKASAASSGLEPESVDIVVSNGVFHELPSPDAVLSEMIRVLKPNGWVIITDFRDTVIGRRTGAAHREGSHGPFSVGELESLFAKLGLRDVKVTPVRHWVMAAGRK